MLNNFDVTLSFLIAFGAFIYATFEIERFIFMAILTLI